MIIFFGILMILVNQVEIIVRTCHWEKKNARRNDCAKESANQTAHGKIVFCETCDTDGCNTASTRYNPSFVPVLTIILGKITLF